MLKASVMAETKPCKSVERIIELKYCNDRNDVNKGFSPSTSLVPGPAAPRWVDEERRVPKGLKESNIIIF